LTHAPDRVAARGQHEHHAKSGCDYGSAFHWESPVG
jgi:hypothetical protein